MGDRPTAMIREIIVLSELKVALRKSDSHDVLKEELAQQIRTLKQKMDELGIAVITHSVNTKDIYVQYRYNKQLYEVTYMRAMLDAEAKAMLNREGVKLS